MNPFLLGDSFFFNQRYNSKSRALAAQFIFKDCVKISQFSPGAGGWKKP